MAHGIPSLRHFSHVLPIQLVSDHLLLYVCLKWPFFFAGFVVSRKKGVHLEATDDERPYTIGYSVLTGMVIHYQRDCFKYGEYSVTSAPVL